MGLSYFKEEPNYGNFDADSLKCCQLGYHVVLPSLEKSNFADLGFFVDFPLELISHIGLNFLSLSELVRLSLVSKAFWKFSSQNLIWKPLYDSHFDPATRPDHFPIMILLESSCCWKHQFLSLFWSSPECARRARWQDDHLQAVNTKVNQLHHNHTQVMADDKRHLDIGLCTCQRAENVISAILRLVEFCLYYKLIWFFWPGIFWRILFYFLALCLVIGRKSGDPFIRDTTKYLLKTSDMRFDRVRYNQDYEELKQYHIGEFNREINALTLELNTHQLKRTMSMYAVNPVLKYKTQSELANVRSGPSPWLPNWTFK